MRVFEAYVVYFHMVDCLKIEPIGRVLARFGMKEEPLTLVPVKDDFPDRQEQVNEESLGSEGKTPAGAEARFILRPFTARINPCPFKDECADPS